MRMSLNWFSLGRTRMLKAMMVFALLAVTPAYGELKTKPQILNAEFEFGAGGKTFPIGLFSLRIILLEDARLVGPAGRTSGPLQTSALYFCAIGQQSIRPAAFQTGQFI